MLLTLTAITTLPPTRVRIPPADVEPIIAVAGLTIGHTDNRRIAVVRRRLLHDTHRAAPVRIRDHHLDITTRESTAREVRAHVAHRPPTQRAVVDPITLNANLEGIVHVAGPAQYIAPVPIVATAPTTTIITVVAIIATVAIIAIARTVRISITAIPRPVAGLARHPVRGQPIVVQPARSVANAHDRRVVVSCRRLLH